MSQPSDSHKSGSDVSHTPFHLFASNLM